MALILVKIEACAHHELNLNQFSQGSKRNSENFPRQCNSMSTKLNDLFTIGFPNYFFIFGAFLDSRSGFQHFSKKTNTCTLSGKRLGSISVPACESEA